MQISGINMMNTTRPLFKSNSCRCCTETKNAATTEQRPIDYSLYFPSDGDQLRDEEPQTTTPASYPKPEINLDNYYNAFRDGMVVSD